MSPLKTLKLIFHGLNTVPVTVQLHWLKIIDRWQDDHVMQFCENMPGSKTYLAVKPS